jgi:hypothetical protein
MRSVVSGWAAPSDVLLRSGAVFQLSNNMRFEVAVADYNSGVASSVATVERVLAPAEMLVQLDCRQPAQPTLVASSKLPFPATSASQVVSQPVLLIHGQGYRTRVDATDVAGSSMALYSNCVLVSARCSCFYSTTTLYSHRNPHRTYFSVCLDRSHTD